MEQLSLLLWKQFRHRSAICARCLYSGTNYFLPAAGPATSTRPSRRHLHSNPYQHKQIATPAQRNEEDESHALSSKQPHQAYPLQGYYLEILSNPYSQHPARRTRPPLPEEKMSPPEVVDNAKTQSPESAREPTPAERMGIVFGTRLAGPGYAGSSGRYDPGSRTPESTWRVIYGIPIPPRPQEPDNCCMSGCVHCVWDDYRDDVEGWAERVREAKRKGKQLKKERRKRKAKGKKGAIIAEKGGDIVAVGEIRHKPRKEVESASMSMDDDGGGSEVNWASANGNGIGDLDDDLFADIPVGIREFMRIEKKLRERRSRVAEAETGSGGGDGDRASV
ncbi:hypothetical protein BDDG_07862 [Blastomyces dermatitidis ATCC 18188]|uniref:Oxidoreductase-like domain-containing protein n=1 Tax=Ajellomyces dermatitidis (strain ATCC 18188 / CBS 674.68) TaxID=653446 RepID=F2TNV4_AJEDA|nr:hypothetical protein BDDG_07862 [Blastomyces dermatitidis ATCC 18188]